MHRALPGLTCSGRDHFPKPARLLLSPGDGDSQQPLLLYLQLLPVSRSHTHKIQRGQRQLAPFHPVSGQIGAAMLRRGSRRQQEKEMGLAGSQKGTSPMVQAPQSGSNWKSSHILLQCYTLPKPCWKGRSCRNLPGCLLISSLASGESKSAEKGGGRFECQQTPLPGTGENSEQEGNCQTHKKKKKKNAI